MQVPSAQPPPPASATGTGFSAIGAGDPPWATTMRSASQVDVCPGCQLTEMLPPSEGPLTDRVVPYWPFTPSCSPVSRLSSAPRYSCPPVSRLAAEASGVPVWMPGVTAGPLAVSTFVPQEG